LKIEIERGEVREMKMKSKATESKIKMKETKMIELRGKQFTLSEGVS